MLQEHSERLPNTIFLDVNMPRVNGWDCLERLKGDAAYTQIPAILYSTSALPQEVARGLKKGAKCFITKPGDFEVLKTMLQTAVANLGAALGRLAGAKMRLVNRYLKVLAFAGKYLHYN